MAAKRGLLLMGCAVAVASAPLAVAAPAAASTCPNGTSPTRWEGVCAQAGSSAPAFLPPGSTAPGPVQVTPGDVPSVGGVPCTPEHYGTCLAMQQNG